MAYCKKTGIVYVEGEGCKGEGVGFSQTLGFAFVHPVASLQTVSRINWEQKAAQSEVTREQVSGALITLLRALDELDAVFDLKNERIVDLNRSLCTFGIAYLSKIVNSLVKVQREGGKLKNAESVKFAWFAWCTADLEREGKGFDLQAKAHLTKLCVSFISTTQAGFGRGFGENLAQSSLEGTSFMEVEGFIYEKDELFTATVNYTEDNLTRIGRRNAAVALKKIRAHIKGSALEAGRAQKLIHIVELAVSALPQNVIDAVRIVAESNAQPELLGAVRAYNTIQQAEADSLAESF